MCTNKGKTCVPKHLCVNGTINTSGIAVINVRSVDQIVCSEDEVCCALPAEVRALCGRSLPDTIKYSVLYIIFQTE